MHDGNPSKESRLRAGCLTAGLCASGLVTVVVLLIASELRTDSSPTTIDQTQEVPAFPLDPDRSFAVLTGLEVDEPGRVVLDVEGVNLTVAPGPAAGPIRIEGSYDAARFALTPEFSTYGDRGWVYRLRVRGTGLINPFMNRGGPANEIRVTLPRDHPFILEGSIENGNTRMELGGLWAVSADLRFQAGDHRLAFSEPLPLPMSRLALAAPMGELTVVELGNASPRETDLRKNLGEACIDLRGAWQADATISVACGVASCDLHEPGDDDAVVQVALNESSGSTPAGRSDPPVIRVNVHGMLASRVEVSEPLQAAADPGTKRIE